MRDKQGDITEDEVGFWNVCIDCQELCNYISLSIVHWNIEA